MSKTSFLEKPKRSVLKSVTYRVLIIISDVVLIFAVTKRFDQTFLLVVLTNLASTIIYFLHERVWNRVHWGKSAR